MGFATTWRVSCVTEVWSIWVYHDVKGMLVAWLKVLVPQRQREGLEAPNLITSEKDNYRF